MIDHLENGHCRGTKGNQSERILDQFYAGLSGTWRDYSGRIVCPGCGHGLGVVSSLFRHMAYSTTCGEARSFRAGYGYTWSVFHWVEQSLRCY